MESVLHFVRRSLSHFIAANDDDDVTLEFEKLDVALTPNMRALRLVTTLSDYLLSMGMPAHSMVNLALNITDAYCKRKVHIDISYTQITLSQDRGVDHEPLTLIRTISPRETNYRLMQQLQDLSTRIAKHRITLDNAETQLDAILAQVPRYHQWIIYMASGGVSAGSALLYSASPPIIFLAFLAGTSTAWLLAKLSKIALPAFFTQIIAAFTVTVFTAGLTWLVHQGYVDFLGSINPTIITIAGIIVLFAGMAIVGAFQDAIDEYYVTAGARLLRVAMMTMGIVVGVAMGLYTSGRLGVSFALTPDRLTFAETSYQYLGALIISASFALGNHTRPAGVVATGLIGLAGYYVFLASDNLGLSAVAAYAFAGVIVGFVATLMSRVWHMPSLAIVNAGIVPLVPGLTLYNGLMALVNPQLASGGTDLLLRAILISVAIAAGASFGVLVGRPTRHSFVMLRNRLPQQPLHNDD